MKKWLARLGWMFFGAVLLAAFVIGKALLSGEYGQMLPDASASQIAATLGTLKKENCSYKVTIYVPKTCKSTKNFGDVETTLGDDFGDVVSCVSKRLTKSLHSLRLSSCRAKPA